MQGPFGDWLPEVVVFRPTRFEDAQAIVLAVRDMQTVLVQASGMAPEEAQRLIDFVAGGVAAIDGQAECLDEFTFVFAPEIVTITRSARSSG